jgi:hypothetical protein
VGLAKSFAPRPFVQPPSMLTVRERLARNRVLRV